MTSETVITYYWKVILKGHLRPAYLPGQDVKEVKGKAERVGTVVKIERLMLVKKSRAKGYSCPTTFWTAKG